jgi:uncharacterized membrane protein YdjX (TVP38/TMEM64 family)
MRWATLSLLLLALILIPFFIFEDQFNTLAAQVGRGDASTWYVAVAIFALLASDVVLPIPSSLISAAAGVLLGFWKGTAVIWFGMTGACLLGYVLGARASGFARRFVGDDGIARAERLAAQYGDVGFVVCRPVPVLAEASVIFAGLVRTPFRRFAQLVSWSNLGIAMGYAAVGAFSMRAESFLLAFAGALALPAAAWVVARLWFRKR